ncbi:MAG: putative porin [Bacteroides sp.]|nr:putative porin [Bacteroides sp.]MDD2645701.1 putative porin [Bacteroides sp.]MDD4720577.1 putative porin [Bacteroides sp.]NLI64546.1 putative porin [Bacteroidales bacterium]
MKRILFTIILFSTVAFTAFAQVDRNPLNPNYRVDEFGNVVDQHGNQLDPSMVPQDLDSANVEIKSLAPKLYMWTIDERLGNRKNIEVDTTHHHFQNSNLVEGYKGHFNHLGNLGSPRYNRLFFLRDQIDRPFFITPYSSFFFAPEEFKFANSNIPYTNLTYYKAGSKINGEERFKSYFSVNANKRFAFGFNIDYLYGRGYYHSQSTAFFNAGLFASYIGDKYQLHAMYNNFTLKMAENAGITDDKYITHPEDMAQGKNQYEPQNIPTNLDNTWNRNTNFYIYLNHKYNLGFHKESLTISENNDSTYHEEFIPVTSFIHTLKLDRNRRRYISRNEPEDFYPNTHINRTSNTSNDSTTYIGFKNTFAISLLEGFHKYAKSGLTAYISHKISKYDLMNKDSVTVDSYKENQVYFGGELARRQGKIFNYNVTAEVGVAGKAVGEFDVKGNLDFNFKLWNDTVNFVARGGVSRLLPNFYMRHYHSNHFYWDEGTDFSEMNNEITSKVEGELNISNWDTNIKAGIQNIKNYTYFNGLALPSQAGSNIQVVSASLNQNFKLGIFHLDNEVTWQNSSNNSVLPLPKLSLYHNLYIKTKLAKKVLSLELGGDVRYFSKYKGLAYTPAIQNFHLQNEESQVDIGGYPIVNVYANLHLKRTRFFVMFYHINQGSGNSNYFLTPHHPINPRLLKFGLSWNFYD